MSRRVTRFLIGAGLAICCGMSAAFAQSIFPVNNQAALSRGVLLPVLGESVVLPKQSVRRSAAFDLVSEYVFENKGREQITLDGETTRFGFRYAQGLGHGWEWGLEVPVYRVGGGFLDSFIERWHGWFGLPQGGREQAPRDRLRYQYRVNGVTVYEQSRSGAALGDVRVEAGWQWRDAVALRAAMQLPSGNAELLTGGESALAVWMDGRLPVKTGRSTASLGLSLNQKGEALPDQQRPAVLFAGLGYAYPWNSRLEFAAQLYAHSPLYQDSALDALSRPGLQLTTGLIYRWSEKLSLRAAFGEDPVTRSSPDFSLHFGFSLR